MSAPEQNTQAVSSDVDQTLKEIGGCRVYIGNLPYSTTEEEIRKLCGPAGGEILGVILPTKGGRNGHRRPAGFSFVHFKDEVQATAAVQKLTGIELSDRKLTFQIGRSKEEQAARREQHLEKRAAARAAREERTKAEGTTDGEGVERKRITRKRLPRRRRPEGDKEGETNAETDSDVKSGKSRRGVRKPREARIDGEGDESDRNPKQSKQRLRLSDEQSVNAVFVGNLPFTVGDDELASMFTNLSIRVKSAKIICGYRRGRGGRPFRASRGFGIVELEDSNQQQEAVDKLTGHVIGDRAISAKIAKELKPVGEDEAAAA